MVDERFFKKAKEKFTLGEIAEYIGAELDPVFAAVEVRDVASLDDAGAGDLTFFDNKAYLPSFKKTRATACIVHPNFKDDAPKGLHLLLTPMPYLAYAKAAQFIYPFSGSSGKISKFAHIDPSAKIAKNVEVASGAVIEKGAEIGEETIIGANAIIGPNVKIGAHCRIDAGSSISHALLGDNVRIFPGVRIGQAGFGFAFGPKGYEDIPQLGRVIVENHVLIGANTTIDRGTNGDTIIGQGTMIDNLVQIGHNVKVGRMCVIVAQCGIAGSTVLEDFVIIGGQTGLAGHITIGTGAKIAAGSGVMRDIPAGQEYVGAPAMPKRDFFKQVAILRRLIKGDKKKNKNK